MSPAPLKPCLACGRLSPRTRCRPCEHKQDKQYDRYHRALRLVVLERDGYECQCEGCPACGGHPCGTHALTADHIIPLARGGTSNENNLQAMCRPCNSSKRDR